MKVFELIDCMRREKRSVLNEAESKTLLSFYGVPVVQEKIVTTADEAVAQSLVLGFPLVLKGLGIKLTHKTERGLVKVNLCSPDDVRHAYYEIKKSAAEDWEGCLIQPLINGRREFVAGLFRDAQFGPVVMFGLGGIFTEAIADVTFRIAPLSEVQARKMLDELSARKLLNSFRGDSAVDRGQLIQALMGLSQLGMENPEIKEVDINPLIAMPDGCVKAVDALVILDENEILRSSEKISSEETRSRMIETRAALDLMAHARSIAVVGATDIAHQGFIGMFLAIRNFGFPGRIYPVNPKYKEIGGYKAYPDLLSLPERVDLVIISVPASFVPDVLRDCIASGNKNIHIFTSGFIETGEEEGIKLHKEIEKIAREGNLIVMGPNCMGIYNPESRMLTWDTAPKESGPVGLISQSGGNARDFTSYMSDRYRIHFSKSFSYGNALTLDSTDFLDYLAHDDKTSIICMYLEGIKDGRLLLQMVTETNQRKPVIILKGGLTESGARAVSSHTGSLAGGQKIWKAFFRQSGAVQVNSIEEMADVTLAFNYLGKPASGKAVVLTAGGGVGVAIADSCAKAGLELPAFSPETEKKLRKFIPPAGSMIRNPIDAYNAFYNLDILGQVLDTLATSGEVDNFIVLLPLDWLFHMDDNGAQIENIAVYLAREAIKYLQEKQLVVVLRQYEADPIIKKKIAVVEDILLSARIPVYDNLFRGVTALAKLAEYSAFQREKCWIPGIGHVN